MDDIQLIPKARIPIVKFWDPRSGLDVDISLDNRLAIYNSMMLKSYAQRSDFGALSHGEHWASRRGINNAFEGTLFLCMDFTQSNTHRLSNLLPVRIGRKTTQAINIPQNVWRWFDDEPYSTQYHVTGIVIDRFFDR